MAEKSLVPYSRCGLVNKVNRSPIHAFDLGLWDKDSSASLISTFYGRLLHILKLDSERSTPTPHKTTILSRSSIAACIENDHLNNSVDEGAIKRDKQSGKKKNSSLQ